MQFNKFYRNKDDLSKNNYFILFNFIKNIKIYQGRRLRIYHCNYFLLFCLST